MLPATTVTYMRESQYWCRSLSEVYRKTIPESNRLSSSEFYNLRNERAKWNQKDDGVLSEAVNM